MPTNAVATIIIIAIFLLLSFKKYSKQNSIAFIKVELCIQYAKQAHTPYKYHLLLSNKRYLIIEKNDEKWRKIKKSSIYY